MAEYLAKVFLGGVLGVATFVATVNAIVCAETRVASTAFVGVAVFCAFVMDTEGEE